MALEDFLLSKGAPSHCYSRDVCRWCLNNVENQKKIETMWNKHVVSECFFLIERAPWNCSLVSEQRQKQDKFEKRGAGEG